MKNVLRTALLIVLLSSCNESKKQDLETPKSERVRKYKVVTEITSKVNSYQVNVTTQSGGNVIERGAGGAILGGLGSMIIGGSAKSGAIVGGLIGASTTDAVKVETHVENRTDVIYTIKFNNGTFENSTNFCNYVVGDSIEVY